MALGEILRNAREQKGLTPSAVAESTHMKVQIVEDLEREEFKRIAAPIYGRGFVKLYAEFLQVDPEPLIRDFMDLYAGARTPAVRVKRSDSAAEQQPEGTPVTRTVTGGAPQPQRQPVQARPAVRPLSAPLPVTRPGDGEGGTDAVRPAAKAAEADQAARAAEPGPAAAPAAQDEPGAFVVVPEEGEGEADEPDLFRLQSLRRRAVVVEEDAGEAAGKSAPDVKPPRKAKLPVYKIGGRLDDRLEPAPQDEAVRARKSARVQAFLEGVRNLKDGVERNLPTALPRKRMIALCGAGAVFVAFMAAGVGLLFKMTGANVRETAGTVVESVASPPSLYVD
jgi:hypothetical protein